MNTPLNSTLLTEFLKRAGERLYGEWLLVGGTLLPAVGIDVRATVDIDLLGLGKKPATRRRTSSFFTTVPRRRSTGRVCFYIGS